MNIPLPRHLRAALAAAAAIAMSACAVDAHPADGRASATSPRVDCGPAYVVCADNAAPMKQVTITVGYQTTVTVSNWDDVSYLFRDDAVDWTAGKDVIALVKQIHASSAISEVRVQSCWHRMRWEAVYTYEDWLDKADALYAVSLHGCMAFNS